MNSFLAIFKKQGGVRLLAEYWRAGVFGYALCQILITGFSKKSLEIVREGVYLKLRAKLRKIYYDELRQFDLEWNKKQLEISQCASPRKVWMCWLQGFEQAPDIIRRCVESLKINITDREVVFLDANNLHDYIQLPEFIVRKYASGLISPAHYTDILRVALLCKYGGTWIDSSVFVSGGDIPRYMLDSDLFCFQNLTKNKNDNGANISNWFITASPHNKILEAQLYLLYIYWQTNNRVVNYFFFHILFSLVTEYYKDEWSLVMPYDNSIPHILQLMQFDEFDPVKWEAVMRMTPIHKLTYKISDAERKKQGTYFQKILVSL